MKALRFATCILCVLVLAGSGQAFGDKLCLKVTYNTKKRRVSTTKTIASTCPKGYLELIDTASFVGPTGPAGADGTNGTNGANGANGADGADGSFRAYGDGSDGDVAFVATTTFDPNKQYDDITVTAGATLVVPPGTFIRCTGTFTNNGTIIVFPNSRGVSARTLDTSIVDSFRDAPSPGSSLRAAQNGGIGTNAASVSGGLGGVGMDNNPNQSFTLLRPGTHEGGGTGGGSSVGTSGAGGGSTTIHCQGAVANSVTGLIQAIGGSGDGEGSGGGAGGLVVLASHVSVTNAGSIDARAGSGATGDSRTASGGGGSGGVVRFISPSISNTGTVTVTGGAGGTALTAGAITANPRSGGGGGGALAGNGGSGADAEVDGSCLAGASGNNGTVLETTTDPLSLLL